MTSYVADGGSCTPFVHACAPLWSSSRVCLSVPAPAPRAKLTPGVIARSMWSRRPSPTTASSVLRSRLTRRWGHDPQAPTLGSDGLGLTSTWSPFPVAVPPAWFAECFATSWSTLGKLSRQHLKPVAAAPRTAHPQPRLTAGMVVVPNDTGLPCFTLRSTMSSRGATLSRGRTTRVRVGVVRTTVGPGQL